jgi:protein involved in polysaccharide export with SLBB domain
MVLTRIRLCRLLPLLVLLCGCETGQALRPQSGDDPAADPAIRARFEAWSDATPIYRIGEGDKLRVQFPLTPEMDDGEVVVRPDGMITLRTGDEVKVADLTPAEACAAVARSTGSHLRDPKVVVSVQDPISARIYIGGEVKTPGVQHMTGSMTIVGALQLASGPIETARLDEVILIRRAPDGRAMLRLVDLRGLLEGKEIADPRVFAGDILYVPRSRIAELDLWIDQFINRVVPFQRSFSYSVGASTYPSNNGTAF